MVPPRADWAGVGRSETFVQPETAFQAFPPTTLGARRENAITRSETFVIAETAFHRGARGNPIGRSETFVYNETAFQAHPLAGAREAGRSFCVDGMLSSLLQGDIAEEFSDHAGANNRRDRHEIPESQLAGVRSTLLEHEYELRDEIGAGGFATIYTAFSSRYRQVFAVKVTDLAERSSCTAEIDNLLPLLHPNIIKLYDTFEDDSFVYIVFEYCPGGTLKEMVKEKGAMTFRVFQPIAVQLLNALIGCHTMGVAHSDIKPPNVFFDQYGRAKLADFGLSHPMTSESSYGGSVPYMAPEVVQKVRGFDAAKADLWSLGVTFYYCGTGKLPWKNHDTLPLTREISAGFYATPPSMDKRILSLVAQILKVDPTKRASPEKLLEYLNQDGSSARPPLSSAGFSAPASPAKGSTYPESKSSSPMRWVDSQRKVGKHRKSCSPMMFDLEIPAQPDMSEWS
jgi:serine/threonine protein kinase